MRVGFHVGPLVFTGGRRRRRRPRSAQPQWFMVVAWTISIAVAVTVYLVLR